MGISSRRLTLVERIDELEDALAAEILASDHQECRVQRLTKMLVDARRDLAERSEGRSSEEEEEEEYAGSL